MRVRAGCRSVGVPSWAAKGGCCCRGHASGVGLAQRAREGVERGEERKKGKGEKDGGAARKPRATKKKRSTERERRCVPPASPQVSLGARQGLGAAAAAARAVRSTVFSEPTRSAARRARALSSSRRAARRRPANWGAPHLFWFFPRVSSFCVWSRALCLADCAARRVVGRRPGRQARQVPRPLLRGEARSGCVLRLIKRGVFCGRW